MKQSQNDEEEDGTVQVEMWYIMESRMIFWKWCGEIGHDFLRGN